MCRCVPARLSERYAFFPIKTDNAGNQGEKPIPDVVMEVSAVGETLTVTLGKTAVVVYEKQRLTGVLATGG